MQGKERRGLTAPPPTKSHLFRSAAGLKLRAYARQFTGLLGQSVLKLATAGRKQEKKAGRRPKKIQRSQYYLVMG